MNTREDWLAVSIRLFVIWVSLAALVGLPDIYKSALNGPFDRNLVIAWALVAIVFIVVMLMLWFFPLTIARSLLPVMKEPQPTHGMNGEMALTVGITLIGLWLAAGAVVDMGWVIGLSRQAAEQEALYGGYGSTALDLTPYYWSGGVKFVVGLVLTLGASGLKNLLFRARFAGARIPPETNDQAAP